MKVILYYSKHMTPSHYEHLVNSLNPPVSKLFDEKSHIHKQVSDLESNNVLTIDFTDVMLSQQAVAGSRAILDQWGDFTRLVDKAHVARAVFVHGDGALKWPWDTHKHTALL